jgi:PAS domain S-box-containing protein
LLLNRLEVGLLSEALPFAFGGVPVLVALLILGTGPGLLATGIALLGGLAGWSATSFGAPFAIAVITSLEALAVYWAYRRWRSVVLGELLFWMSAGWLLDFLLVGGVAGWSPAGLMVLFVTQLFNGLVNGFLVEGALWIATRAGLPAVSLHPGGAEPLRGYVFRRLVPAVVAPALLVALLDVRTHFQRDLPAARVDIASLDPGMLANPSLDASLRIVALFSLLLVFAYWVASHLARRLSAPLAAVAATAAAIVERDPAAAIEPLLGLAHSEIQDQREVATQLEAMRVALLARDADFAQRRRIAIDVAGLTALDIDSESGTVAVRGGAFDDAAAGAGAPETLSEVFERIAGADRQAFREALDHVRGSGGEVEVTFRRAGPEGEERFLEGRVTTASPGGTPASKLFCVVTDTSRRRAAERALRASEEKYRKLFESLPIGVALANERGEILAVNEALLRPGGWSHADIEGRAVLSFYEDLFHRAEVLEKLSRKGRVREELVRFRRKDGGSYVGALSLERVDIDDKPCVLAMIEDTSEKLELQEQLVRAQRIEAIGRLAGGVAHDFNNLVTVILGSADLVLRQLADSDPRSLLVQQIEQAARRASNLTRQLLTFARRESAAPQAIDLNLVVADLERMLRRLIEESIDLRTVVANDLWPCRIDPAHLEQVLVNLVVNARDAMPNGGTVIVSTRNRYYGGGDPRLPGLRPGEYVCVTVEDNGIGMDEQVRGQIFEPFFTTKGPGGGTGLGLSTCYGIVTQAGGQIRVDSAPGCGAKLEVFLPRAHRTPAALPEGAQSAPAPGGSERVLVVEDEPMLNEMTCTILRQLGYRVLGAASGSEAIALIARVASFDLLVTDIVLPGASGHEVAEILEHERPNLRVLFISGYASDRVGSSLEGANRAFLGKPFTRVDLARAVRDLLDRRPATPETTRSAAG